MACGEYTVRFTLNLAEPRQMLEALDSITKFLDEAGCRSARSPAWTLAICGSVLVRVWAPTASELPIRPLLRISIQSSDPSVLVDVVNSIKNELERRGLTGLTME